MRNGLLGRTFLWEYCPEWTKSKVWFDLLAGKSVALLDLSHFCKQRWVIPQLSASMLLMLMVFVVVHLRAFLLLRWKDERMGRKQVGKEIYKCWISWIRNAVCCTYLTLTPLRHVYLKEFYLYKILRSHRLIRLKSGEAKSTPQTCSCAFLNHF